MIRKFHTQNIYSATSVRVSVSPQGWFPSGEVPPACQMERRQVERRLDKMERRIEEAAGCWAFRRNEWWKNFGCQDHICNPCYFLGIFINPLFTMSSDQNFRMEHLWDAHAYPPSSHYTSIRDLINLCDPLLQRLGRTQQIHLILLLKNTQPSTYPYTPS